MSTYIPNILQPTAITKAEKAVVTTSAAHNFVVGNTVRFLIPADHGMVQLNNQIAKITAVSSDTITIDINTTTYTTFAVPRGTVYDIAQIVPIGDCNFGYLWSSSLINRIKGAFVAT